MKQHATKQHITIEQLEKLFNRLSCTWKSFSKILNINLEEIHNRLTMTLKNKEVNIHELVTIGKMIEVIKDHQTTYGEYKELEITYGECQNPCYWYVNIVEMSWENPCLCDALFEALCYILGEE